MGALFSISIFVICSTSSMRGKLQTTQMATPYTTGMTIVGVISSLEACPKILFKWFDNNYIKANSNKSHLPLSTESDVDITANVSEDITSNTKSEKLLGVTIDPKLTLMSTFLESVIKLVLAHISSL